MTEIAILLNAEPATLAPGQRLVIPKAARVEADISAECAHIAQHWRCHGRRSFGEHGEVLAKVLRFLDRAERGERSDFDRSAGLWADSAQLGDAAQIEHITRLKQLLPHRWNQVGAAGEHADVRPMFREKSDGFVNRAWP